MRLIDADFVLGRVKPYSLDDERWAVTGGTAIRLIHNAIDEAPTIDAVPVVRCRECKHQKKVWNNDKRMKEGGYWIFGCERNQDTFVSHTVDGYDDDFCSHGERKEEQDG